jgi:hypothetical protein
MLIKDYNQLSKMDYFFRFVKKHKFAYIVTISVVATVLILNNAIEFAERIINNTYLLIFSLMVFYFLVRMAIIIETKKK